MNQPLYTVKIGGQAGQGIKSAGLFFAKVATRSGYHIYDHTEYPSLIRGGHNVMLITFGVDPVTAPRLQTDLLVALNQDTLNKHFHELKAGSGIIFDKDAKLDVSKVPQGVNILGVPLAQLAGETGGKEILINTVAVGATLGLLGANLETFKTLLEEEFKGKGPKIVALNHKAAVSGYSYVVENYKDKVTSLMVPHDSMNSMLPRMILNGNEGVALGAIAAGLQFAAIYPMSPASNILHVLAANQEKYNFVYKQPEDEIAAINMAIGASFAGARSMTSTSGGGFALMGEGYGLAGMVETPLVIIDGMRGAPATGLPTWTEQSDLRMVLHAHQGDFPRIVLAASDPKDSFEITMKAFNLADKYQTTVMILLDKQICENDQSFEYFDASKYKVDRGHLTFDTVTDFKRYNDSPDGVSMRSAPGFGNFFIANSDEHDEFGYSTEEIDMRNIQMNKRMRKLETCAKEDMEAPIMYGPKNADLTIVSWGSNRGTILEALKSLPNVNYMHIVWMNPFPSDAVLATLKGAKKILNVECNYSAQLGGLIREKTGFLIENNLLKYDGRPFYPGEIIEKVTQTLKERNK